MKHPCHKDQLANLKRIEGQVKGIQGMIEDNQYCIDILNQIKAVRSAITSVEGKILKKHLRECLRESLNEEHSFDEKVDELIRVLKR